MLASERVAAPADAAEFFGIEAGAEICRIKRMHELNGEPLSVVISYLPVEYAEPGQPVQVEIFGEWVAGEVAAEPLFDPGGERIRA